MTTPSGRAVKLERITSVERPSGERALMLSYRTQVDVADVASLRAEIRDVWGYLQPRVEERELRVAIIRATDWDEPGWERTGRAVQYVIARQPDGVWRARDDVEPGSVVRVEP